MGRFLKDLHKVIIDNYEVDSMDTKTDINAEFANTCWQIIDNNNIGPYDSNNEGGGPIINYKNVRLAGQKIENLK